MISWIAIGSMIFARLVFRPDLPKALIPTIAIELAPPALASGAWFALNGLHSDAFAFALAGFAALMVIAQVRLFPTYFRLSFTAGFWAFTFPWCAVASLSLDWIKLESPSGGAALNALVLAAVTILVGGIGIRTLVALRRRQRRHHPQVA